MAELEVILEENDEDIISSNLLGCSLSKLYSTHFQYAITEELDTQNHEASKLWFQIAIGSCIYIQTVRTSEKDFKNALGWGV